MQEYGPASHTRSLNLIPNISPAALLSLQMNSPKQTIHEEREVLAKVKTLGNKWSWKGDKFRRTIYARQELQNRVNCEMYDIMISADDELWSRHSTGKTTTQRAASYAEVRWLSHGAALVVIGSVSLCLFEPPHSPLLLYKQVFSSGKPNQSNWSYDTITPIWFFFSL